MKFLKILIAGILFDISLLSGQGQVIHLINPSFESMPQRGGENFFYMPGWNDCAPFYFANETPPDIHGKNTDFFKVNRQPQEGNTFLGMVTRSKRETWEMISQQLPEPLLKDKCYEFKIHLAKSDSYYSGLDRVDTIPQNFNTPVKLRIWGSNSPCKKTQLLAQSGMIKNTEWKEYTFKFKPKRDYYFILLEAFYKTPVLIPYNGNILLDNASDIVEIPCPNEESLAKVDIKNPKPEKKTPAISPEKSKPVTKIHTVDKPKENKEIRKSHSGKTKPKKGKILKKLDKNKISTGQIIKIENLYFDADSSNIKPVSYPVLDEIYTFLKENPNVIIEIGGHTNGIPKEDYCNRLSTARAKNVAEYLYNKGIPKYRIKYKGYGKTKPVASDKTLWGRKQNQRVEIKILKVH